MYDEIMISIVFLFLTGVIFICTTTTVMSLFVSRASAVDLFPIAMKGAKISIVLATLCGVLELVSPGSVLRATGVDITTAVLFVWSCGLIYLIRYRDRSLHSENTGL
jgi:hypothetical protein